MRETNTAAPSGKLPTTIRRVKSRSGGKLLKRSFFPILGLGCLFGIWWLGGWLLYHNPNTRAFAGFGPIPAFQALWVMLQDGTVARATASSLYRIGYGLLYSVVLGLPLGIAIGLSRSFRESTHLPFQFLRMISPLSWEPIAVIVFATWDQAIIFLIAAASMWPVTFSTASGLAKVDPAWFKVARNLGARPWHMLTQIVMPAIAQDILTGIRLALGVAWIVLVPAEFLGVTSGLGYAIEDARETLQYSHLAGMIVVIGITGFAIDSIAVALIRRYSWVRE